MSVPEHEPFGCTNGTGIWVAAQSLCPVAQDNLENEAERQQIARILPCLNRKLKQPLPVREAVGGVKLCFGARSTDVPVAQVLAQLA
jgi:hypothetical protein